MAGYIQAVELTVIADPPVEEAGDGSEPENAIVFLTGTATDGLSVRSFVVSQVFPWGTELAKGDIDALYLAATNQAYP